MPDYGRPVEFGFFLVPNADEYPQLIEQAELADRLGLEYIGGHEGVRWATMEEIAEDFRRRFPFSGTARPRNS